MPTKHQKFRLNLTGYSLEEREAIAVEVIDKIIKRTKQGLDKNGQPFEGYSKAYKDSLNFKIAGKSSKVDLTLSGDMLDSIKILNNAGRSVEIGFEEGSEENGKADGNIRGTYGKPRPVGPPRPFLGISDKELKAILNKYPPKTERSRNRTESVLTREEASARLSGQVDVEDL